MDSRTVSLYYRRMPLSLRAAIDDRPGAPVAIQVLGLRQTMEGRVHTPTGLPDWFCAVSHQPQPFFSAGAWEDCPAGTMMLSGSDEAIGHGAPNHLWTRSWLRLRGNALSRLQHRAGLPRGRAVVVADPDLHTRWLEQLYGEVQHPRGINDGVVEALVLAWWCDIARQRLDHTPPLPRAIRQARQIIDERFREALRLDALAASVGLSRSQLCRGFRRAYDCAPMAYAQRLRLELAEDLLLGGDLSLGAIAERCGFHDAFYFSKAFKARFGLPPGCWRTDRKRSVARPSR